MFKSFVITYDHRVDLSYIKKIQEFLKSKNIAYFVVADAGETNDYPILARKAYQKYLDEKADGMILLCGTGVGMNVVANKCKGIRSVLPESEASAFFARNDENANAIVFPAGKSNEQYSVKMCKRKMIRILDTFISSPFEGGRHQRRLNEITQIEEGGNF